MPYTAAQKRAYAIKMKKRQSQIAPGIYGAGDYYSRRASSLRGRGDYKSFMRKAQKVAGYIPVKESPYSRVGQALGGNVGRVLGAGAGMALKALGMGDYKVDSNSLLDATGIPQVMSSGSSNSITVRQKEYLQDITTGTSGAFSLNSFPINPGLVNSFPWLSQIAACFEEYQINGMIYEFKSTSADALNSTNTALGTVILATEYDSSRALFVNKQQMENHEFANSTRQSSNALHAIECKKKQSALSELYVRTGSVPTGDDERLFDFGIFQIATLGGQASAVNIGELWVSYDITFYKKQLITGLGLQLASAHYYSATAVSTSNYFGTSQTIRSGTNLSLTLGAATITFPSYISEGSYKIDILWVGDSTACTRPTITATSGCAIPIIFENDTVSFCPNVLYTTLRAPLSFFVNISAQSAVITLSAGTLPANIVYMDLIVNQINANIQT